MSATICGGRLYLLGGWNKNDNSTRAVFMCTLDSLFHSCHQPSQTPSHTNEASVWQRIADIPMWCSTCTTLNGMLLAVGGEDSSGIHTADVYMYDSDFDTWPCVGYMSNTRSRCLVVGLKDCIIAVGGYISMLTMTSSVEVGYLQLSDKGEERHLAALEVAIQSKRSLNKTIMQCVFIGIPRSGKSTLMKRLVGECPTPSSPSTGVVDKVVQVEIMRSSTTAANVSGSTWVKLSHDDETVAVVMDTAQSHPGEEAESKTHSQASVAIVGVHQAEPSTTVSESCETEHRNQPLPHQYPSASTDSTQPHLSLSSSATCSLNTADLKAPVDLCKSALRRTSYRVLKEQGWMVHLMDTGGQIEFQELLPVLVSGPLVFFLVFRLDHDFNKNFTVEYVHPNGTKSESYPSNFTVKEVLLQFLTSIASLRSTETHVFFVGTHKDKVSQTKIDRIDCSLRYLVTSTGLYRKGMIQYASEGCMLLAVNNLSDDDSDIQLVRAAMERLGSQGGFTVTATSPFQLISRQIAAVFRRSAEQRPNDSSLLVGFRCGYCPKGLFAALVIYLLANATSHSHKWVLQKDQIFKDQISFLVRSYDTVTITVQPKLFVISCTPASSDLNQTRHFPLATVCGEVQHCLERGIRKVLSTLYYTSDAAHYLAFYCPGDHQGPDAREPHPAEIHFQYSGILTL